jgi:hypothetical protein
MPENAFTSSTPEVPGSDETKRVSVGPRQDGPDGFSFGERMRVLRSLHELEFGALERGASPEGAVLMVYKRALDFYDREWPLDEGNFRNTLLRMQEKRMQKVMREKRRKSSVFFDPNTEDGFSQ